jgi:hypothetical protein
MLSKQITFECDWDNEQFVLGDFKFTLEDIKFDQSLKDIVKANIEHTDIAVLRLTYPEIYNELFTIEQVVDWDLNQDPDELYKKATKMKDFIKKLTS